MIIVGIVCGAVGTVIAFCVLGVFNALVKFIEYKAHEERRENR